MTAGGARTGTGTGHSPVPVAVPAAARHAACILACMHWTAAIAAARIRAPHAAAAPVGAARASNTWTPAR